MAAVDDRDRDLGRDYVARAHILSPASNRLSRATLYDREISHNEGERRHHDA